MTRPTDLIARFSRSSSTRRDDFSPAPLEPLTALYPLYNAMYYMRDPRRSGAIVSSEQRHEILARESSLRHVGVISGAQSADRQSPITPADPNRYFVPVVWCLVNLCRARIKRVNFKLRAALVPLPSSLVRAHFTVCGRVRERDGTMRCLVAAIRARRTARI